MLAAPSGSAPTIRTDGHRSRSQSAIPAIRPPPPTGTTTVSNGSGHCSCSSIEIVPWPAIVRGSSNGWASTAPVASLAASAAAPASSYVAPPTTSSIHSPPMDWIRSRFWRGVAEGTNTRPWMPRAEQLSATPWAWLPALAHTTPRRRSSAFMEEIRLYAPLTL